MITDKKYGVLLVNLGTPAAPDYLAVRKFLRQFLSDPRVVDTPRLIWFPILYGFILSLRPFKVSKNYQKIWTEKGSPLMVHSLEQKRKLQAFFDQPDNANSFKVELAMTYGNPSINASVAHLRTWGAEKIIVLPLYPQYSYTTTAPVTDQLARLNSGMKDMTIISDYHDDDRYINALVSSIKSRLKPDMKLIMSFHGLPRRYIAQGDPYQTQSETTALRVATKLGLNENQWEMAFQSRVGREEWLSPYLDQRMTQLPSEGVKNILVVCPGFSVDCLETLEEIAVENKQTFLDSGGEQFEYVEALNASDTHIEMMANFAQERMTLP